MPYFSIETNQTIDQISNQELLKKTSAYIAGLLGKPEMMGKPVIKGTRITGELILMVS